jgi:hypothetical protein
MMATGSLPSSSELARHSPILCAGLFLERYEDWRIRPVGSSPWLPHQRKHVGPAALPRAVGLFALRRAFGYSFQLSSYPDTNATNSQRFQLCFRAALKRHVGDDEAVEPEPRFALGQEQIDAFMPRVECLSPTEIVFHCKYGRCEPARRCAVRVYAKSAWLATPADSASRSEHSPMRPGRYNARWSSLTLISDQ